VTHPLPGPSALTIEAKKTPGSLGALMKPTAVINGHTVPLQWGTNVIPAPPGVHDIKIHCQYLWKIGKAEITVDNTAAPAPPVYYAAPWTTFNKGAIGLQPVKNPGALGIALILGVPVLLVVLCIIGATLADSASAAGY
jgi:hypothetical protein